MKLYQVNAERSGGWWALSVPGLRGLHSQCRRFREAEAMATEAIALFEDVDPSTVHVVVTPVLGDPLDKKLRHRRELAQRFEAIQHDLAAASLEVVRDMVELGLTQRDAADVLGLSFQRVNQLWPRTRTGLPALSRIPRPAVPGLPAKVSAAPLRTKASRVAAKKASGAKSHKASGAKRR